MPLTQSFPSGSILLVRFPAQSCIVLYGNISQAMGLVAGNGLLRHHKTVLRNRYNRSFGIADVVFLTGEGVTIIRCRHVGLCPLLAEGIVIVLFDHRTVGGDNLPHAAQMIRQKIARFHSARRGHYAPATETRTLEYSVIIYQRTCITNGFVVVVSTHLNLRPVER